MKGNTVRWGAMMLVLLLIGAVAGCRGDRALLDESLRAEDVQEIRVVLAMGNPKYGADARIITDREEITALIDAFNGAVLGDRVGDMDVHVAGASRYEVWAEGDTVRTFFFNGNDSRRVWTGSYWQHVRYPDRTPYEIYRDSEAEVFKVDEDGEPMQPEH